MGSKGRLLKASLDSLLQNLCHAARCLIKTMLLASALDDSMVALEGFEKPCLAARCLFARRGLSQDGAADENSTQLPSSLGTVQHCRLCRLL